MFTASEKSNVSSVPSDFSSHPIDLFAQPPMENQQSSVPIYAVRQHSKTSNETPPTTIESFMFPPTPNNLTSVGTNFESGSIGPFIYRMPSVEDPDSMSLLFPIPSPNLSTPTETQHSGDNAPTKFGTQSSTFVAQTSDMKYLDPNLGHIDDIGNPYNPTWSKSILNPLENLVKVKRVYKCEPCRVWFQSAQAFGGHMSYHSKVRKGKGVIAVELDPVNSKKTKIEPLIKSMNKETEAKMHTPMKSNVLKGSKESIREVLNRYNYKNEGVEQEPINDDFEEFQTRNNPI
ncbi:unnamed protein product [Musa hybrid cultivar]